METERKLVLERLERTEPLSKLIEKTVEQSDHKEFAKKSSYNLYQTSLNRGVSLKEDTDPTDVHKSSSSDDDGE